VAFIDADAIADSDWLYHLVETMRRRGAAAAGGPNFPPAARSSITAAIAGAPGQPREVRSSDDSLASFADATWRSARPSFSAGRVRPFVHHRGDDVDISWRLLKRGVTLAYAPAPS